MDNSSSDGSEIEIQNTIIGFKKQTRYTNIDYRAKLALKSNEISKLRLLSSNIQDADEFNVNIVAIITIILCIDELNPPCPKRMKFCDSNSSSSSSIRDSSTFFSSRSDPSTNSNTSSISSKSTDSSGSSMSSSSTRRRIMCQIDASVDERRDCSPCFW